MSLSANGKHEDAAHALAGPGRARTGSCEGTVINVRNNKLLMRIADGVERSHILAKDVHLTCDGDVCTANYLKIGYRARVTTQPNNRNIAIRVEAIDVQTCFSQLEQRGARLTLRRTPYSRKLLVAASLVSELDNRREANPYLGNSGGEAR